MIKHRDFNLSVAYLGVPNTGKTDAIVRRCMDLMDDCYILAHDGSLAIPDTLHDGTRVPLIRYDNFKQCVDRIKQDPRGIHSFSTVKLKDLMDFAVRLACASLGAQPVMQENAQLPIPKGGKGEGAPVVILVDEAVMASEMKPNYFDPAFRELISQRRHKHVGILWGTQSPGFVHHQAIQLGNEVVMFRCNGLQAAQRLRDATVPESIIRKVMTLPDHESITYVMGSVVPEELPEVDDTEGDDVEVPEPGAQEPTAPIEPVTPPAA